MSGDKRVQRNSISVQSLADLLSNIISDPTTYVSNQPVLKALCSQGALAKYSDNERNITPSSINTIKRIANVALDGGFNFLDLQRIRASQAIEKVKTQSVPHRNSSKSYLISKNKELQLENQTLKENLLLITDAFYLSLTKGASYARSSEKPEIIDICRKEQTQLLLSLSLIKTPLRSNVVHINEK